jgi:hypothetical protein
LTAFQSLLQGHSLLARNGFDQGSLDKPPTALSDPPNQTFWCRSFPVAGSKAFLRLAVPVLGNAFRLFYYVGVMADEKDSIFDKAETMARRIFERLGAKVDHRLSKGGEDFLSKREIDELLGKIERAIDANLKVDNKGIKRIAPNCFKVMFTYERAMNLNNKYLENLYSELKAASFEYITNRRYESQGPLQIIIVRDFFEKSIAVKAAFDAKDLSVNATDILFSGQPTKESKSVAGSPARVACTITLRSQSGETYSFELKVNGQPVCIGRSSGNRLRIDDNSISRVHCSFALHSNGQAVLADLNSSNGTLVNGQHLKSNEARSINKGDVIQVGDIVMNVVEIV